VKLEPSDTPKLTHCFASSLCESERYRLDASPLQHCTHIHAERAGPV
jgi:hypothetical protein